VDVAALAAHPLHLVGLLEDLVVLDVGEKLAVARLVHRLGLCDHAEGRRDVLEAFLLGDVGERRVKLGPLLLLAGRGRGQVLRRGAFQRPGGIRSGDLDLAAFQVPEEALRMLTLVFRCLQEDGGDLLEAVLLRRLRVEGVAVARLALAGERFEKVLLGLCALDARHSMVSFRSRCCASLSDVFSPVKSATASRAPCACRLVHLRLPTRMVD